MGWIGCVRCEKFWCDFMARTFALLHKFSPFCIEVRAVTKQSKIHPNTTKHTKTWVSGPTGWIGSLCCKKFWCEFVARTFALIAPVHPVLQLASCSNKTIQNAPKNNETHKKWVLGPMGWIGTLQKIPMRLRGTKFCINCTSSARFVSSFVQ